MNPTSELLSSSNAAACKTRQNRLQQVLRDADLDALLLSSEKDIHYMTGFVGHESLGMLSVGGGSAATIISDSRYDQYLEPWRKTGTAEVIMGIRHRLPEAVRDLCQKRGIKRLGIQAEHVTILGRTN